MIGIYLLVLFAFHFCVVHALLQKMLLLNVYICQLVEIIVC